MQELNRDDIYYLNAEQEAEKMKREEYEDILEIVSHWREDRLNDVHEAEERLHKAKDALVRTEKYIKKVLAPFGWNER